jgi:hypothetical protein
MTNEIEQVDQQQIHAPTKTFESAFNSIEAFEAAQRMVGPLAQSELVPANFRGKVGDCVIALDMSRQMGMSVLAVMQNMYIVHGKPAWSAKFLVACVNGCGKFSPLRYMMSGEGDTRSCIAWALDKATGERLESISVSVKMAKAEGWFQKKGSKWQTMPDLMLQYRSATFFARVYCPEISMGMQTQEEIIDVGEAKVSGGKPNKLAEKLVNRRKPISQPPEEVIIEAKDVTIEPPEKPEEEPAPKAPGKAPKAYSDLNAAYSGNEKKIDELVAASDLPYKSFMDVIWQDVKKNDIHLFALREIAAQMKESV